MLVEPDEAARLQSQTTTPSLSETSSGITKVNCELLKPSLQTFDGCPAKWSSFWDMFETVVDKNSHLTEIDKFDYLMGQPTG